MIDTNALFRKWLLTDQALLDLVTFDLGDGAGPQPLISCPDLPEKFDPTQGHCAVTFGNRGGSSHLYQPIASGSIQVRCWALEPEKARAIYGAIFDLVHGQDNISLAPDGYVLWCKEQVLPQDLTDPETGWSTAIGFFEFTARAA